MKISTQKLLKAITRKRAREGPSEGRQAPASKRPTARVLEPPAPQEPSVAPKIDLTADTSSERAVIEEVPREEPTAKGLAAVEEPAAEGPATVEESVMMEELLAPSGLTLPEAPRSWGEGPSGAASPPLEQTPTSSPHVESENAEAAEGRGTGPRPPRDSILNDGRWAEQILSPVFMPEVLEELSHLKAGTFFRESYAALVRLANFLRATREVIHGGKALLREAQKEAEEAHTRAVVAEGALESARAARAEEIRAAENRAKAEANRLRAALNQMTVAKNAVAARYLHISKLTSAIQMIEGRATEAEERVRAEGERSRVAEEKARAVEEKARAAEEKARAAEERADQVEEEVSRAQEAERAAVAALAAKEGVRAVEVEVAVVARTARVIEEYKASERFADDLAKASTAVFLQGFQHRKKKVSRDLNFPQALEVKPDHLSDSAPSDDEPAPAEP